MTGKKILAHVRQRCEDHVSRMRKWLDTRSQRQRLWIILAMFAAFTALDVCVIAWSFLYTVHSGHIQTLIP